MIDFSIPEFMSMLPPKEGNHITGYKIEEDIIYAPHWYECYQSKWLRDVVFEYKLVPHTPNDGYATLIKAVELYFSKN